MSKSKIDPSNYLDILTISDTYDCGYLMMTVAEFTQLKFQEVMKTD